MAAVALWAPAFREPLATGYGDWQYFHHMWEAGYVAITRFGELPLWDPFHCGGITIFGNPQNQLFSPLYVLAFVFGPTLASKLFVIAHASLGFAGMYLLARRHRLSLAAACFASLAWSASGFFAWHGGTGHAAFLPFYFAPWVVLCVRASAYDVRYAVALAGLLALTLLEGGVYPFPFFLLLIGVTALFGAPWRLRGAQLLRALALAGLLTLLLGAVRLWPILDESLRNPRTMPSGDGVTLLELLEMLTARRHTWRVPHHWYVWPEYGCYVGSLVCALAACGALVTLRRGPRWWLTAVVIFAALTLGEHGPASPWALLRRLPLYDALRVPTRFVVLLSLFLALLAGRGFDALLGPWPRGSRRWQLQPKLTMLVLIASGVNLVAVQYPVLDQWHDPPIKREPVARSLYLSKAAYAENFASFPSRNLGTYGCYEAMTFTPAPGLWVGDLPQARLRSGHGRVTAFERTSSRFSFDVALSEPGRVIVNQNFAPGWHTSVGSLLEDHGRLAIDLPPGKQRVHGWYLPSMFWPSLALSALGCLLAALVWLRATPRWQP